MAKIVWDQIGERYYETGVRNGVLYIQNEAGNYNKGVAWNGLTTVSESPSGAEPSDMYADDIKYASVRSAETFGATIEAYTYPDEFAECDGSKELAPGITVGQQERKAFGFSYRTKVSNDNQIDEYKIHLVYGATASPSEKSYATINDSPEANTFSWELTTNPVNVDGMKPTSVIIIDSLKVDETLMKELETILYGSETAEPRLPMPNEIVELIKSHTPSGPTEQEPSLG